MGRVDQLCLAQGAFPPDRDSNPIEVALYTSNPFQLSEAEAEQIRFEAVRHAFAYHFQHNAYYRQLCQTAGLGIEDIREPADMARIPLVPEHTFKACPGPEQLLPWLASINSDEMPWPAPGVVSGSYDEQLAALRHEHGILVRTTSGSSGVPSFLSRDETTRRRSTHWKIVSYFAMYPELVDYSELLSVTLWPLDFSWADLMTGRDHVHALLDKKLGIAAVVEAMTRQKPSGIIDRLLGRGGQSRGEALLVSLVEQLGELAQKGLPGVIWTPPFILYSLARYVQEQGLDLSLGPAWRIELGGGWKLLHEKPITEPELRRLAHQALGVPEGQIHDIFGSTEGLGLSGMSCEGGYKHVPHTVVHPMVLNEQMEPVANGEWGRFAYLNPLIQSYPGFILSADRVRMWSRCPVCDRSGPVLDAEISRMPGAEERGCANIVQHLIDERIGG